MASLIVLEYLTRKACEVAETVQDGGEPRAGILALLKDVHRAVQRELSA